jgi:uncharacterized protein (TIGR00730 family)
LKKEKVMTTTKDKEIPAKDKVVATKTEIQFFEGPQSRWKDFKYTVSVFFEFIKGFRALHFVGPCVTVFGSARFKEDHPFYEQARQLSGEIAQLGFTIMTGGGPGIMEAANRGAKDVGGKSVGCNIVLPHEQKHNPYLDKWVDIKYFFIRKMLLIKYSYAFIVMPGGFGTLDEFYEALTLVQTQKIEMFPIIIFDKDFYKNICQHNQKMFEAGTISANDESLYLVTDSIPEAIAYIKEKSIRAFGLKYMKPKKPIRVLFEKGIERIFSI